MTACPHNVSGDCGICALLASIAAARAALGPT